MQYGFFDDQNREYVITRPDTPYPWINYLGCDDFFGLFSNTSGGYCFYRDAKMLRLTRYRYNNVPTDAGGRYFYLKDGGDTWTPSWMPMKSKLDRYECRHGMGYSKISSARNGLAFTQTSFVPLRDKCEIHKITLTNDSNIDKNIDIFSFVEFCLWNAQDDMANFQRNFSIGEVEIEGSRIYHKTEYRERRNHYAVWAVNTPINGFDTDRQTFLGLYNGFDAPQTPIKGEANNSVASGWAPVGSHHIKVKLSAGESKSFVFVLGYCENDEDKKWEKPGIINKKPANALLEKYNTPEAADKALAELNDYWKNMLGKFTVDVSASSREEDKKMERMAGVWNQYQCMVTFNMSRSASYFESGIGR
ncbi:MAG: glycosyl transferase, partial [Treponema sp.]|nr:glycosyl transferase [Treponema sp.]